MKKIIIVGVVVILVLFSVCYMINNKQNRLLQNEYLAPYEKAAEEYLREQMYAKGYTDEVLEIRLIGRYMYGGNSNISEQNTSSSSYVFPYENVEFHFRVNIYEYAVEFQENETGELNLTGYRLIEE